MPAQQTSTSSRGSRSTAAFNCTSADRGRRRPAPGSKTSTSAPPAREPLDRRGADPARAAGDERDATLEVVVVGSPAISIRVLPAMSFDPSRDYPLGDAPARSRPRRPAGMPLAELELRGGRRRRGRAAGDARDAARSRPTSPAPPDERNSPTTCFALRSSRRCRTRRSSRSTPRCARAARPRPSSKRGRSSSSGWGAPANRRLRPRGSAGVRRARPACAG